MANTIKITLPYVSYRTFRNFLELLGDGMPARIDRSVWGPRYSGTSGQQLMTALKSLELINDAGVPSQILEELSSKTGNERRSLLKILLESKYNRIFSIDLKRATRSQFNEAFRAFGIKDGVMNKCQLFFIQACQDAGIELSGYILARRHNLNNTKKSDSKNSYTQIEKAAQQEEAQKLSSAEAVVSQILNKYPEFNPSWTPEVQETWMQGMIKLYEGLKDPENNRETT